MTIIRRRLFKFCFVFGLFLIITSCATARTDDAVFTLEGTWATADGMIEFIFDNGTFEILEEGVKFLVGAYTEDGRRIITQVEYVLCSDNVAFLDLTPGLYSREQLRTAIEHQLVNNHITQEQSQSFFERGIGSIFETTVINFFSVRGNTLLLDWYDWPVLLDRKN